MTAHTPSCALESPRDSRSGASSFFRFFPNAFAALLAPGECRLCDGPLLQAAPWPVCGDCLHAMRTPAHVGAVCSICSDVLDIDSVAAAETLTDAEIVCHNCQQQQPPFARAVAGNIYDAVRPAVHLMKFEGVPALAQPLAAVLAQAMLALRPTAPTRMTVVPVPLYRGKRAYNQSTLLARHALQLLRRSAPDWQLHLRPNALRRTRHTESQYLLSREQRQQNVHGAFAVQCDVRGHDVLLIDDVYTTGATVAECARVLLAAGAASVHVATLARAAKEIAVRWQPARDGPLAHT